MRKPIISSAINVAAPLAIHNVPARWCPLSHLPTRRTDKSYPQHPFSRKPSVGHDQVVVLVDGELQGYLSHHGQRSEKAEGLKWWNRRSSWKRYGPYGGLSRSSSGSVGRVTGLSRGAGGFVVGRVPFIVVGRVVKWLDTNMKGVGGRLLGDLKVSSRGWTILAKLNHSSHSKET